MKRQYPENKSHKLRIDNYRAKLIRHNDENSKLSKNVEVQIEIKPPREQKKKQLKIQEYENTRTKLGFNLSNMRIMREKTLEPIENDKKLKKPNIRMRKSFSTQVLNPLNKEKDFQNDLKQAIGHISRKYSEQYLEHTIKHFESISVLSRLTASTFAICKSDLIIFIKCLIFFNEHHQKKKTSNNHLFVDKVDTKIDLQQMLSLFSTWNESQQLNQAETFKKELISFKEKQKKRTMEVYNKKINQINETIKQLKEIESHLTNKILEEGIDNEVQFIQPREEEQEEKQQIFQYSFAAEYKKIQEDLKDYALTLQTQKMKRKIKSDFSNFSNVQASFQSELLTLTKLVNYDDQLTPPMKIDLILNFLRRTMQKLKQWGEEVQENVGYKVGCITEFIIKIKNWYNQVLFREEFLSGIKTELTLVKKKVSEQLVLVLEDEKSYNSNNSLGKELKNWIERLFQLEEKVVQLY